MIKKKTPNKTTNHPLKSGKRFGKKRKQERETIKNKMAFLKSVVTISFFG
jgi:hypothetical protein